MNFTSVSLRSSKFLLLILVLSGTLTHSLPAAVIKVRNLNDDGKGSLRRAIETAGNRDRIEFAVSGRLELLTGEFVIDKDLTIEGPSSGELVIDAAGNSRIFNISQAEAEVTISKLKLTNGKDLNGGGGISSAGHLTLLDCGIENCAAAENTENGIVGGSGGGVLNLNGKLNIFRSTITGGIAVSGGGVDNIDGTLFIINSHIDSNLGGSGGGIEIESGTLVLVGSSVSSNRSSVNAAGIEFYGPCTALLERCEFVRNNAGLGATAILTDYGCNIAIHNSTFLENIGDYGDGGAIMNWDLMSIVGCTFTSNRVYYFEDLSQGGAIYNSGPLTIENSTFSGNRSGFHGGAIMNTFQLTLRHCTLTKNESRYGGGFSTYHNPDVFSVMENTIVAGNIGTGLDLPSPDFIGTVTSLDYNLIGQLSNGTLNGPADHTLFGTLENPLDALLGPLQFNGGPTHTHLPLPGSPAIDTGSCTGLPVDQRGYYRPVGVSCDIGSVEVQ